MGDGDKKAVLDAVIADAKERGIPCRITGVYAEQKKILEELYPGKFRFHSDRGGFDYVYSIDDLAELGLGLEDRLSSKVGLLSGGQRQAVTLLMATLKKPKLLLLDEHTAALDPKTAAKVLEITD